MIRLKLFLTFFYHMSKIFIISMIDFSITLSSDEWWIGFHYIHKY